MKESFFLYCLIMYIHKHIYFFIIYNNDTNYLSTLISTFQPENETFLSTPRLSRKKGALIKKNVYQNGKAGYSLRSGGTWRQLWRSLPASLLGRLRYFQGTTIEYHHHAPSLKIIEALATLRFIANRFFGLFATFR